MEIRGVSKSFHARGGTVAALEPCDLAVATGEFVTVVGPSGCGKSTLMMHRRRTSRRRATGEIPGRRPGRLGPPGRARTGVFQRFALLPSETVAETSPSACGSPRLAARRDATSALAEQARAHGPRPSSATPIRTQLSGGMQQRVAHRARARRASPTFLLMDEPFGALDAQTRDGPAGGASRVWGELHYTVLFITHSVEEAVYLATASS